MSGVVRAISLAGEFVGVIFSGCCSTACAWPSSGITSGCGMIEPENKANIPIELILVCLCVYLLRFFIFLELFESLN